MAMGQGQIWVMNIKDLFRSSRDETAMVKLVVKTDPDAWHGTTAERMWATPIGSSSYVLENSPFHAYGLSYKDVVTAQTMDDGQLHFVAVSERGGHSTYRILLKPGASREDFDRLWKPLEAMGCTYESSKNPETNFAIDVPPSTDVYDAYKHFEAGLKEGVWDFEEGHCGHPLKES